MNPDLPLLVECTIEFLTVDNPRGRHPSVSSLHLGSMLGGVALETHVMAGPEQPSYPYAKRSLQILYRREIDESDGLYPD